MRSGTLTKIDELEYAKVKNNIPIGDSVKGYFFMIPTVGRGFVIQRHNSTRCRLTSMVIEVVESTDKKVLFKTLNSMYELKFD